MAVGPTESLNSGILRFSPGQVRIMARISSIMQQFVTGASLATVNPDRAIKPSGQSPSVSTEGIGSRVDFQA